MFYIFVVYSSVTFLQRTAYFLVIIAFSRPVHATIIIIISSTGGKYCLMYTQRSGLWSCVCFFINFVCSTTLIVTLDAIIALNIHCHCWFLLPDKLNSILQNHFWLVSCWLYQILLSQLSFGLALQFVLILQNQLCLL